MMLQGVLSIAEGLNQKLIRMQLEAYSPPQAASGKPANAKEEARAAPASAPVRS
jgi:hypothetical protein